MRVKMAINVRRPATIQVAELSEFICDRLFHVNAQARIVERRVARFLKLWTTRSCRACSDGAMAASVYGTVRLRCRPTGRPAFKAMAEARRESAM
jgi:hypothetical protein